MAKVHVLNVCVHNNPASFTTPFQFEIHFECLEDLKDDLEFKIIYVGSAETYEYDQVLDQIVVDAVPQGQFKFMFQADAPNINKIPKDDVIGVTVLLITACYRQQEFVRIGYYVSNEYTCEELREQPPSEPLFDKIMRTIAANEPRVTKFKINWDDVVLNDQQNDNVIDKCDNHNIDNYTYDENNKNNLNDYNNKSSSSSSSSSSSFTNNNTNELNKENVLNSDCVNKNSNCNNKLSINNNSNPIDSIILNDINKNNMQHQDVNNEMIA